MLFSGRGGKVNLNCLNTTLLAVRKTKFENRLWNITENISIVQKLYKRLISCEVGVLRFQSRCWRATWLSVPHLSNRSCGSPCWRWMIGETWHPKSVLIVPHGSGICQFFATILEKKRHSPIFCAARMKHTSEKSEKKRYFPIFAAVRMKYTPKKSAKIGQKITFFIEARISS